MIVILIASARGRTKCNGDGVKSAAMSALWSFCTKGPSQGRPVIGPSFPSRQAVKLRGEILPSRGTLSLMPIAVVIGESWLLPPMLGASVVSQGRGAPMRAQGFGDEFSGRDDCRACRPHSGHSPHHTPLHSCQKSTVTIIPKVLETEIVQD